MKCINCGKEINFSCGTLDMAGNYCQTCWGKLRERSNTRNYVNMLNRENSELLVNSLAEKDKQIVELQKQLEEKEKLIEKLQGVIDKLRDKKFAGKTLVEAVNAVYEPLFKNKCDEVEEIKQQLKSQPAEIVEKIRKMLEGKELIVDGLSCQYVCYSKEDIDEIINFILKEYQKGEN